MRPDFLNPVNIVLAAAFAVSLAATAAPQPSQYAGQEQREIKALSPADVDGLLSGSGMGYAKAAELNGLAGPRHVLDLAAELALTPAQRDQTDTLFARMQADARSTGKALVDKERELDQLFATRSATPPALERLLSEISALQAKVRAIHLKAHLAQVEILTPEQNARYAVLRGYAAGADGADATPVGHSGRHKH